jgi:hypothetical protein
MHGINFKLVGAIIAAGFVAFLVYDVTQGVYDKDKLAKAGWTPKA